MGDTLDQRFRRFVGWGLYFAGFCCLFLIPAILTGGNQPIPRYGVTPLQIAFVYVATGVIGGMVVALAYPISRWFLGAFILGTLAAAPAYIVFGIMMQKKGEPAYLPWIYGGVCAVVVGGGLGTQFWSEKHDGAERATVFALWVVVLFCLPIGFYLGLRYRGETRAAIGLALAFIPLWIALLATIGRRRSIA